MQDMMRRMVELERELAELRRHTAGIPSRVARPTAVFTWPRLQNYTTSSGELEITAPAGVAMILAVGGGGGGGGGAELFGGGGGGGGMAMLATVPVTGGTITVTVSIGAGGAGADGSATTPSGTPGTDGGTTTVTGPSSAWFISALGGSGGGAVSIEGGLGGRYSSGEMWDGVSLVRLGRVEVFRGQDGQAGLPFAEGLIGTELGGYGGQPIVPAWVGNGTFGVGESSIGLTTAVNAGAGGRGGAAEGNGAAGSSGCVLIYY